MMSSIQQIVARALKHVGFRQYAANTLWTFAEQILRIFAALSVGVWVARSLGPEQFGVFSYAIAFAALFGSIAKLGLDSILVRDLVREPGQRDRFLGTAFWLKLIGSVAMLGVVGVALQFTSSDSTTKLYIFIIASGAIFQSFEVIDFYFQSKVMSMYVSICKLTQLIVSSSLKLFLIYEKSGLFGFVLVSVFDQVTLALTLYLVYRYKNVDAFFKYFEWGLVKRLLRDSWSLMLSGLVIAVYMRIDQVMIKEILGEREVGLYSAATRISEVLYFVPVLIVNSFFPYFVNAKESSRREYLLRLQQLLTFLLWIAVVVAALATLMGDWLVLFLYGSAYRASSQALMIHAWGGVFVALGVVSGGWYINENLQLYIFYRAVMGAILNVLLNFFFIPVWGISGAAIATVVSQAVATLFFDLATSKTRVLFIMKVRAFVFAGFVGGAKG